MANIFGTKHDIDNRQGLWKVQRVTYIVKKFHDFWSTNGLKLDRIFTHRYYFVPSQSIVTL